MAFKYRADQVGSLLRPKELLEAIRGGVAEDKLKTLEDQQILRVLGQQKDLGFKIFSDGEFRRRGFMSATLACPAGRPARGESRAGRASRR